MPHAYTVDESKMQGKDGNRPLQIDFSKPQGYPGGLPVIGIPLLEYPRVIYKHPTKPYRDIEHRNALHEVVDVERVPAEHLTKTVENEQELKHWLGQGWRTDPYVPEPLPDPNADLYGQQEQQQAQAEHTQGAAPQLQNESVSERRRR